MLEHTQHLGVSHLHFHCPHARTAC